MCRSPKCFLQVLAFWKNKGFIVKIRNRKTDGALRLNILKYLYLFICLFIYLFILSHIIFGTLHFRLSKHSLFTAIHDQEVVYLYTKCKALSCNLLI